MTVYNLGSINLDHVYFVPRLPVAGETISALGHMSGLGGKGANQSVAAARAGARTVHIGCTGGDSGFVVDRMAEYGVDISHISIVETDTGHAIVQVDPAGENAIVIFPGANVCQTVEGIENGLADAGKGDVLILQNETNLQPEAARIAAAKGMKVVYSAAPFDVDAVRAILAHIDTLIVNQVEAEQLSKAFGVSLDALDVSEILVTRGRDGAELHSGGKATRVPAISVDPVDTTGAGDTFAGYFVAARDLGNDPLAAMKIATAAAALKVTKKGTADAIPSMTEVVAFLAER